MKWEITIIPPSRMKYLFHRIRDKVFQCTAQKSGQNEYSYRILHVIQCKITAQCPCGPTKNPRLINCFSLYKEQTVDSHSHPKKLYTKKLKTIVQLHIIICFFSVFFFVSLLLFPRRHIFYLLSRQSMPPLSVVVQSLMETYALR